MRIIKYCKKEHNCHKGAKLLIGNLEKYRSIENKELQDTEEGTFSVEVKISEEVTVPRQISEAIFPSFFKWEGTQNLTRIAGDFSTVCHDVDISSIGPEETTFKRAHATITYGYPNALIFCTSMVSGDPIKMNPFPALYGDYYDLGSIENAENIGRGLTELVMRQTKAKHFANALENVELAELRNMNLRLEHGSVVYLPRVLQITKSNSRDLASILSTYARVPFCKPTEYANEREYRFVFRGTVGNRILPARNMDVLVDPVFIRWASSVGQQP